MSSLRKRLILGAVLWAGTLWLDVSGLQAGVAAGAQLRATVDPSTRVLNIAAEDLPAGSLTMRIDTRGMQQIETGRDTHEPGILYLPPRQGTVDPLMVMPGVSPNDAPPEAENVFIFNDFFKAAGWNLVVQFAPGVTGTWKLNGRFSNAGGEIWREIEIPVSELELGENLFHFASSDLTPPEFFYRRVLPEGRTYSDELVVGHADWSGTIRLESQSGAPHPAVLTEKSIAGIRMEQGTMALPPRWWEQRMFMEKAALAAGRNILAARIENPRSMFAGGFNHVYDLRHEAYRMPHWIWAWGPTIKLLLDLEKMETARTAGLSPAFHAAALAAGQCSLKFAVTDPALPTYGLSTMRWEPSRAVPNGWVEYVTAADSLFLSGWGWMTLYRETGEAVYRERTQALVSAAERLMKQYPVVPQDWVMERERWTPHTLDESAFGMSGFAYLFDATHDPHIIEIGRHYIDSILRHMGRESGLLFRVWLRDEDRALSEDPDIKGHAWVMEGYLEAYRLVGDAKYLELARELAQRVMACQADDGAWTVQFRRPVAGDQIDDRGTALWAYYFYKVYRITGKAEFLEAARRALGWCLLHQVRSNDSHLDGALVNTRSMGYIQRRPMTILDTNTFFALALLEELKLASQSGR